MAEFFFSVEVVASLYHDPDESVLDKIQAVQKSELARALAFDDIDLLLQSAALISE